MLGGGAIMFPWAPLWLSTGLSDCWHIRLSLLTLRALQMTVLLLYYNAAAAAADVVSRLQELRDDCVTQGQREAGTFSSFVQRSVSMDPVYGAQ